MPAEYSFDTHFDNYCYCTGIQQTLPNFFFVSFFFVFTDMQMDVRNKQEIHLSVLNRQVQAK